MKTWGSGRGKQVARLNPRARKNSLKSLETVDAIVIRLTLSKPTFHIISVSFYYFYIQNLDFVAPMIVIFYFYLFSHAIFGLR